MLATLRWNTWHFLSSCNFNITNVYISCIANFNTTSSTLVSITWQLDTSTLFGNMCFGGSHFIFGKSSCISNLLLNFPIESVRHLPLWLNLNEYPSPQPYVSGVFVAINVMGWTTSISSSSMIVGILCCSQCPYIDGMLHCVWRVQCQIDYKSTIATYVVNICDGFHSFYLFISSLALSMQDGVNNLLLHALVMPQLHVMLPWTDKSMSCGLWYTFELDKVHTNHGPNGTSACKYMVLTQAGPKFDEGVAN